MNIKKIKEVALSKGWEIKEFCQAIGISEQGFNGCCSNNTMKAEKLELCSKVLKVNPLIFFDDLESNSNILMEDSVEYKKVYKSKKQSTDSELLYRQIIESKDSEISVLKKLIFTLERGTDSGQMRTKGEKEQNK